MSFVRFSRLLSGLLLFLVAGLPSTPRADGKVLRAVDVAEDPWIPDQRALPHWMDGRETLVIETSARRRKRSRLGGAAARSTGGGGRALTELFPELAAFFGPKIITESSWWLGLSHAAHGHRHGGKAAGAGPFHPRAGKRRRRGHGGQERGGWLKKMRSRSFHEVSRWFGEASFGTWLRGVLPASRLMEDVYPVWNGAAVAGLNRAVPVLTGGLLILLAARRVRGDRRKMLERAGVFAARTAGLTQREIFRSVNNAVGELTEKSENSSPATVFTAAALKAKMEELEERLEPKWAAVFAGDEPVNAWPALVFQDRDYGVEAWWRLDATRRTRLAVWDREGRLDESPGRAIPW